MASPNSIPSRLRPVKWIGYCGRCDTYAETRVRYVSNPHPNGMFCPYEETNGGLRGVMHFTPSIAQTPIMLAEDIGLHPLYNDLFEAAWIREEDIDTSDIPEQTDWSGAERGRLASSE